MSTVDTGNSAENAVADRLATGGYTILHQNWKCPIAEIDIVAEKSKTVYFVEVKYRQDDRAGDGFDYITSQKLHHMVRAAEVWVQENNWQGPYELLAAAVTHGNQGYTIELREVA